MAPRDDLPGDDELLRRARDAAEHAYSPYSGVRVGAALVSADGSVFVGSNVENASYGLTQCAERVALASAVTAGAREFEAVVISTNLSEPLPPCGACRQVLSEFSPRMRVVVEGTNGRRLEERLDVLLPGAMGPDDLP